jgi:hypothetical protein
LSAYRGSTGIRLTLQNASYLIGVDEKTEVAYIVSIHGKLTGGISSMPTAFPLDRGNLKVLHDEVLAYWRTLAPRSRTKTSAFVL